MYIVGANPTDTVVPSTDNTKGFGLLDRLTTHNGFRYIYAEASSAIAVSDVVAITSAGLAAPLTKALADAGNYLGVAQCAVAAGERAWFMTSGSCNVNVLAGCVGGAKLYTSATAGKLDDDATSQTLILGVKTTVTTTPAAAVASILAADLVAG